MSEQQQTATRVIRFKPNRKCGKGGLQVVDERGAVRFGASYDWLDELARGDRRQIPPALRDLLHEYFIMGRPQQ